MATELEAIQALAADYEEKAVTLSAESVAVLFYALEAAKSLNFWKQTRDEEIPTADADEIDRIVSTAFKEVMAEVTIPAAAIYPKRSMIFHEESIVLNGGAIDFLVDTGQIFNGYARQTTPAVQDEWTNGCFLRAGTYTMTLIGSRTSASGKVDIYYQGISFVTFDLYRATTELNYRVTASVTFSDDGWHKIDGVVSSKNASSSGYLARITAISFRQANDT